jgi:hypothetical protein
MNLHQSQPRIAALLGLCVLAACGGEDFSDADEELEDTVTEGLAVKGTPFGPSALPENEFGNPFTSTVAAMHQGADQQDLLELLNLARAKGVGLALSLVPIGRSTYYIDNGCGAGKDCGFDLAKWKTWVNRFKTMNLKPYVDDGTIVVHYMLDEPNCAACWDGKAVPFDAVDAAAKHSKALFPYLPTAVRAAPSVLKSKTNWQYLDTAWAAYLARHGNIDEYIANQVSTAKSLGLGLVFALNVINGGVEQDPCPVNLGTQDGKCSMTATLMKTAAKKMLDNPYACAVAMWSRSESFNGDTYFNRTDVKNAVGYLMPIARARPRPPCRR